MKLCCGRRTEPWFGRLTCWRACRRIWSSPDARRITRRNARGCNGASLYVGHQPLYLHPAEEAGRSFAPALARLRELVHFLPAMSLPETAAEAYGTIRAQLES